MATLGDWKTYVQDNAADMSDGKADRVTLRLINNALRTVATDHHWGFYRGSQRINLDQAASGSDLSITTGTRQATLGSSEIWLQKWVDEGWYLSITAETRFLFELKEIVSPAVARLLDEQEYVASTVSSGAYKLLRSKYDLPRNTIELKEVRLGSQSGFTYMSPVDFDRYREVNSTTFGQPTYFTIRADTLEVWPPLDTSTTRDAVLFTYTRRPDEYDAQSDEDTELDWDSRFDDLLEAALDCEIAYKLAGSTVIDPEKADMVYRQKLARYKAEDQGGMQSTTQFSLGPRNRLTERELARRTAVSE